MPLYKTITPNSQTTVKIWKITESYEDLMEPLALKAESMERVIGMKSEIHQRGFLSIRHLLRSFGYTDEDLYYDQFGKPHLKDGKYISIPHSFTFSGLVISNENVGIDIEKQRDKIGIIAHKFVNYEFEYLDKEGKNYIKRLTIIWCIKESLYKLFATPGMLFRNHFLVIPFLVEGCQTVSWIDFKGKKYRFQAQFLEFEGFTCAFTLPS